MHSLCNTFDKQFNSCETTLQIFAIRRCKLLEVRKLNKLHGARGKCQKLFFLYKNSNDDDEISSHDVDGDGDGVGEDNDDDCKSDLPV